MGIYKFETFERGWGRFRRYYFHFKAPNGEIMAQSEAYTSGQARDHAITVIKARARDADIVRL